MTVVILHEELPPGARADELDALVQVREVEQALRRLGVPVAVQAIGLDLEAGLQGLRRHQPACVFNLVESLGGRGELIGTVPKLLAHAGIPFTGSGGDALHLTSHKTAAKRQMAAYGIATADWFTAGERPGDGHDRWIVKSLWEHASFGIDDSSVVTGRAAARETMAQRARQLGGHWFAERYLEGRELNVSLLERNGRPEVLPLAEMTFVGYAKSKPRIVGYSAKWDASAAEYNATQRVYPRLAPGLEQAIRRAALDCWSLFGLRGYARVDIRLDEQERPVVLEVNANPCLSHDAGFAAAAAEAGLSHDHLIETILDAALPGSNRGFASQTPGSVPTTGSTPVPPLKRAV
ncbi:MAG TPA: hypothetical protein VFG91_12135 [Woeseiaceae bacterium]|nr:hypothetical protein [Woeseiaceae bacterium]